MRPQPCPDRRMTDSVGDIILGRRYRLGHARVPAPGWMRSRATTCSRCRGYWWCRYARSQCGGQVLAVKQYIHRTCDVLAALDEHVPARPWHRCGVPPPPCRSGVRIFHICQILRLRYVRRQHLSKRQHGLNKCADRRRIHQRISRFWRTSPDQSRCAPACTVPACRLPPSCTPARTACRF